jgi:hypothetical protein
MTRGFLTFVQNNGKTDYLNLAYLQALSLKLTNSNNKYAVVVDDATKALITDRHKKVFDYIIPIPGDDEARTHQWKMHNEWKALIASPFDETIKLEADILFTRSIDHWWNILSIKDICFTNYVVDYKEQVSKTRFYRKVFDTNKLPDIYAGLYYFKKTPVSKELFGYAEDIFKNWAYVKNYLLKDAEHEPASTDLVFALAARMLGTDNCTLPGPVPTFVHMKSAVQGWPEHRPWTEMVYHEIDQTNLTVGFQRQRLPFHYHLKGFAKPGIIIHYERLYFKQS